MASRAYQEIPYQTQHQYPSNDAIELDPTLIRQFWGEAKRQVVTGDYLRRKWQPLCGVRFYGLVKALRAHCSYEIKDGEAMCYPSEETLARECGVTRRTIINWFQRSPDGRFARKVTLPAGEVRWEDWNWSALNHFLRIVPHLRYDPAGKRSVKTSNRYFIRMDDPPVPDDIPLIWAHARELAIAHLEAQVNAQEQETRRQEFEARAAWAASFNAADFTCNNVKKAPPEQCEKVAQDRLSATPHITPDFHRSPHGEERVALATRSNRGATNQQVSRTRDEEDAASRAPTSKSNSAAAQLPEDRFRRAAPLDEAEECRREEREAALQSAYEAASGVVYSLLEELGDTHAAGGTRRVLSSLVAAGAPPERMTDLAYLARDRVRAFVLRGGRILDTQVGFYITTLCNLAKETRRKGWNLEQIAATDRRRHERLIRQSKQQKSGHTTSQAKPRSAHSAGRRPTPEEAEALVMDLGQQEAVYAEAQAQARQVKEQQQARGARQQAIQQQAHLFSRLAQAEQALTMHPESSLAWERAQREKQELERKIAALRQSGGAASAVPAAPPESIHHHPMQDRSEQEYREAIHAWARARGWTVKHGAYGGSQRDWQIGLMGVGKAELRTLAAELGI